MNEKKTEGTHMQTDCPTEVVRDRRMKGNRSARMSRTIVTTMSKLDEQIKKVTSHKGPRICHT